MAEVYVEALIEVSVMDNEDIPSVSVNNHVPISTSGFQQT